MDAGLEPAPVEKGERPSAVKRSGPMLALMLNAETLLVFTLAV